MAHRKTSHGTGLAVAAVVLIVFMFQPGNASAEWKDGVVGGTKDYLDPNNWVGGVIDDQVHPSGSISGGMTFTFGADHATAGDMLIHPDDDPNGTIALRGEGGDRTLTLNGDFLYDRVGHGTVRIGSNTAGRRLDLDLGGGARVFQQVDAGQDDVILRNDVLNGSFIFDGNNDIGYLEAPTSYAGFTRVDSGTLHIQGTANTSEIRAAVPGTTIYLDTATGAAPNADVVLNGGTLQLGTGSGNNNDRIADSNDVLLRGGGTLRVRGVDGGNTSETLGVVLDGHGRLSAIHGSGASDTVTITANMDRTFKGLVNANGSELGASVAPYSRVLMDPEPSVVGGGGAAGSTNMSIVPWLYSMDGSNRDTLTFATYEGTSGADTGARPLDVNTELHQATISGGVADLAGAASDDNVLFDAINGHGDRIDIGAGTKTINSLVFVGQGGNFIDGSGGTLKVDSGAMAFYTHNNPTKVRVSNIDFNGNEGIIGHHGDSGGAGYVMLNTVLTNTGGNGLTLKSFRNDLADRNGGVLILTQSNTYTGPTSLVHGRIYTGTDEAVPDTSIVSIGSDASLYVGGHPNFGGDVTETIAGLSGNGEVHIGTAGSQLILGTGTGSGGDVVLDSGGSISPGHSIGELSIGSSGDPTDFIMNDGVIDIELGPDGYDRLIVSGGTTLNGGTLNITEIDGYTLGSFPVTFDIFDWGGSVTGQFDAINVDLGPEEYLDTSNLYTTGQLTALPEPTGAVLALLAAIGLLLRRPRR